MSRINKMPTPIKSQVPESELIPTLSGQALFQAVFSGKQTRKMNETSMSIY